MFQVQTNETLGRDEMVSMWEMNTLQHHCGHGQSVGLGGVPLEYYVTRFHAQDRDVV